MELHEALLGYLVGRAEARPDQALENSVLGKGSLFSFGDGTPLSFSWSYKWVSWWKASR